VTKIIYTTCGTSLLESNCWRIGDRTGSLIKDQESVTQARLSGASGEKKQLYSSIISQYQTKNDVQTLVDAFYQPAWLDSSQITKLPAEFASLRTIHSFCANNRPPDALSAGDKLILLYAENPTAEFCAKVIIEVIKAHNLLSPLVNIEPHKCVGLDASCPAGFMDAIGEIWRSINREMQFTGEDSERPRYFLNVTGGYKIFPILMAALAYNKGAHDTHLFYLNVESGEGVIVFGFDNSERPENRLKFGYIDTAGSLSGGVPFPE
jgi:hypothetical protein